jgi:nitrate reductase delta subunit
MNIVYVILSRLIDYPDQDLIDQLDSIDAALREDSNCTDMERDTLLGFIAELQGDSLLEVQQRYVQTFDMVPEYSLHLTHHLFGDDRGRGPALVDLSEHYKGMGLHLKPGEIPDFLPLILEYVATLDELAARFFLGDAAKVLTVVAANLEKIHSPYAPLLRLIEQRGLLAQSAA